MPKTEPNTTYCPATQKCIIVLATTIGKQRPEVVGADLPDASRRVHAGLIQITLPILRATREALADLAQRAYAAPADALLVISFSDLAERERTYRGYATALAATPTAALQHLGLALCGDKRLVTSLTGNLRLLR